MPIRPTAGNVLRAYRAATDEQRQEGIDWYRNAHGAAASLDPGDPARAAGVIAALSPRVAWARNLELAAHAYQQGRAWGTLGRSCRAADAILAGADPRMVLTGPKVRAFFTLINDPDDAETVCVDRHAIDVAVGMRLDELDRSAWYRLDRSELYERFAGCYRRAAARLGVLPGQVQAVTWVSWRERLSLVGNR
jgi:hypothetical protein